MSWHEISDERCTIRRHATEFHFLCHEPSSCKSLGVLWPASSPCCQWAAAVLLWHQLNVCRQHSSALLATRMLIFLYKKYWTKLLKPRYVSEHKLNDCLYYIRQIITKSSSSNIYHQMPSLNQSFFAAACILQWHCESSTMTTMWSFPQSSGRRVKPTVAPSNPLS